MSSLSCKAAGQSRRWLGRARQTDVPFNLHNHPITWTRLSPTGYLSFLIVTLHPWRVKWSMRDTLSGIWSFWYLPSCKIQVLTRIKIGCHPDSVSWFKDARFKKIWNYITCFHAYRLALWPSCLYLVFANSWGGMDCVRKYVLLSLHYFACSFCVCRKQARCYMITLFLWT